jgi:hydroxymethylbilane synthase
VDTRIRKLKEGQYDAVLLALAGLRRLDLEQEAAQIFSPDEICPAAGQGALAIETRRGDAVSAVCSRLQHEPTRQAVSCERTVLAGLGGGCHLPVGAFAEAEDDRLRIRAVVISPDGSRLVRVSGEGPRSEPEELGNRIVRDLLSQGADALLEWV